MTKRKAKENPTTGRVLKCDGTHECGSTVTHIDNKGFVYCTGHGEMRRTHRPCRKMTRAEIRTLEAGQPISYDPAKNRVAARVTVAEQENPTKARTVEVTQEDFDEALLKTVETMSAGEILAVPGVYEVLSEYLNNEALELVKEWHEIEREEGDS